MSARDGLPSACFHLATWTGISYAPRMRRVELIAPSMVFVLATLGCETSADTSGLPTATAVTSIYVDPAFFLGDLKCAPTEGSMRSYVASIYDVTVDQLVTLPATPPTSCAAGVTFRQVVVGHKYRIKIDGYDLAPEALEPLGGPASGSRTMTLKVASGVGPVVTPKWSTHCNDVTAEQDTQVNIASCAPFAEAPSPTGVRVDPRGGMKSATPMLACKKTILDPMGIPTEVGDVFSLNVRPDNPALPALLDLPCSDDGPAPPAYTQNITVGQTYGFRIEAKAIDKGPVIWASSCVANPIDSLIVEATCDPFVAHGAMDVLIDAAKCEATKTASVDLEYPGPPKKLLTGVACGKTVRFSALAPGMQAITAVGRDQSNNVTLEATCSGTVELGSVTDATCIYF